MTDRSSRSPVLRVLLVMAAAAAVAVSLDTATLATPAGISTLKATTCQKGTLLQESSRARLVKRDRRLYGCYRSRPGRLLAWTQPPAGARWSHATLAGAVAAWELRLPRSASGLLQIVDLKSDRLCSVTTVGTGRPVGGTEDDVGEPLQSLVLHRSGSVAFIAGPGEGPRDDVEGVEPWAGYEVVLIDRSGVRQVASGPDVRPGSLRLDGRRVTWRQGAERRSAELGRGAPCVSPVPPI